MCTMSRAPTPSDRFVTTLAVATLAWIGVAAPQAAAAELVDALPVRLELPVDSPLALPFGRLAWSEPAVSAGQGMPLEHGALLLELPEAGATWDIVLHSPDDDGAPRHALTLDLPPGVRASRRVTDTGILLEGPGLARTMVVEWNLIDRDFQIAPALVLPMGDRVVIDTMMARDAAVLRVTLADAGATTGRQPTFEDLPAIQDPPPSGAIQGVGDGCDFVQVAAGSSHSLGLGSDGTVRAWGDNDSGQLGNGTLIGSGVPIAVVGLPGIATQVVAGARHSLALLADGSAWAWGSNFYRQLGDGTTTMRASPVPVAGLSGVTMVAAGQWHSLAAMADGSVRAWGSNAYGQLGTGSTAGMTSPVEVVGLSDAVGVAAGDAHSLAVSRTGVAVAWGYNSQGQIGDGTFSDRWSPTIVEGLSGIARISCGWMHSLAVLRDGTVRAWGSNSFGQLGDGTMTRRASPVPVEGLVGVMDVAGGDAHSLALRGDGRILGWGANGKGQIGDGTTITRLTPVNVSGLSSCVGVAAGRTDSLAARRDGSARAWGQGDGGRLGDGALSREVEPAVVRGTGGCPSQLDIVQVALGASHSLALLANGTVRAWGSNAFGQLGDGTSVNRTVPAPVLDLADVVRVEAGGDHSLAILRDGTVREWGGNFSHRHLRPVEVQGLADIVQVSTNLGHSLALLADGSVRAWGSNAYGQLGDGTISDRIVPVAVPGLSDVAQVAAGGFHSVALLRDRTIMSWGNNAYGQLGDGTTAPWSTSPVQTLDLSDVRQVTAGARFSLALLPDGRIGSWGRNGLGQLGDGTLRDMRRPVRVAGISGAVQLDAQVDHAAALLADGSAWAWGWNTSAQCGDGGAGSIRYVPGPVNRLSGATQIEVGSDHSLALLSDGTAVGWGSAFVGQLGNGYATFRVDPLAVACPGAGDSAPSRPSLSEVEGLTISFPAPGVPFVRRLAWTDDRWMSALDLTFHVASGSLDDLWRDRGFSGAECLASDLDVAELTDAFTGGSRWYLVAMRSHCTTDEWGHSFAPGGVDPRAELADLRPCP